MQPDERPHRPDVVRELIALGWEIEFIASALNATNDEIRAEESALDQPAIRPAAKRRKTTFAASLRRYEQMYDWHQSRNLKYRHALEEALETLLEVKGIRAFIADLVEKMEVLALPAMTDRLKPYFRLLQHVQFKRENSGARENRFSAQYRRQDYALWLDYVRSFPYQDMPASLTELRANLGPYCVNAFRSHVRGQWDDAVPKLVDGLLSEFPPEEAEVLRLQYGLGQKGKSLATISRKVGKSPDEVKAMAASAVKRLGHQRYWRRLRHLFQPLQETVDELSARVSQLEALLAGATLAGSSFSPDQVKLLTTPLQDLGFPPKLQRIFRRVGLITLADLVRHTPSQALGWIYMGRKSLYETEAILAAMGFSLGTELPPAIVPGKKP